jgi:hypothetical protein
VLGLQERQELLVLGHRRAAQPASATRGEGTGRASARQAPASCSPLTVQPALPSP